MANLSDAKREIANGNKPGARKILLQIVQDEPDNEQAWLLFAEVSNSQKNIVSSLNRVLKLNPKNQRARQWLDAIENRPHTETAAPVVVKVQQPAVIPQVVLWAFLTVFILIGICVVGVIGIWWLSQNGNQLTTSIISTAQLELTPSPLPGTPTPDLGKWLVSSETSAIDDTKIVYLSLDAESPIRAWIGNPTPTLVLRCAKNELNAFVSTGTTVEKANFDDTRVSARIRFDKDEPQQVTMGISTDDDSLFFLNAADFINQAINHETLAFEFTPYNVTATETEFDIHGLYDALPPLLDACGLHR